MANIVDFLTQPKSMIIAPAGHGKTHTITECLSHLSNSSRCLILTHTHAGVASLREKMKKQGIKPSKYTLDTISSFALKYTNAFHLNKADFPEAENNHEYFDFAIETATNLFLSRPLQEVLKATFSHLIVDEYQDCSKEQHRLIQNLSLVLPTHILGDPLQGIFGFNNGLVDMESQDEMGLFFLNKQELTIPWRWNNAGAHTLGAALIKIRKELYNMQPINLSNYSDSINLIIEPEINYIKNGSNYKNVIWKEINNPDTKSLLLIHPISTSIHPRIKFIQQFSNRLRLIESIDDKNYYSYAKSFDEKTGKDLILTIRNFARDLFIKTVVDNWFKSNGELIKKRSFDDKKIATHIQYLIDNILKEKSYRGIASVIYEIFKLPGNKCYRVDFCNDMSRALNEADLGGISAYEAIKNNRDILRHQGRRILGKCIGTTLLTKGLEFDTVIVLNAHKFDDPKHLYVALTRACKKLVVITETPILKFA